MDDSQDGVALFIKTPLFPPPFAAFLAPSQRPGARAVHPDLAGVAEGSGPNLALCWGKLTVLGLLTFC